MPTKTKLKSEKITKPAPKEPKEERELNGVHYPTTDILKLITPEIKLHAAVEITPEKAADLLTLNTGNRPLKKRIAERYTQAMTEGKWVFSGNMLKFSSDLVLQDGQHSLTAVVNSGTTQLFNIQTGLAPTSFSVMDTGKTRSGGDVLAILGYNNYELLAAAIKSAIYWKRYQRIAANLSMGVVSNQEVEKWTENKSDIKLMVSCMDYVMALKKRNKGTFLAGSTMSFVYFVLSKIDKEQATEFITRLATGEDLSMTKNSPIYLLREQLLGDWGAQHLRTLKSGGSQDTELKIKYIFRAWNLWRAGEKVSKLTINTKDLKIEKPV